VNFYGDECEVSLIAERFLRSFTVMFYVHRTFCINLKVRTKHVLALLCSRKVRPRTSAWYSLHVDATRQNMILPDRPVLYSFPHTPASKTCVAISVAGTVDPNEPARFSDGKWNST
jgi:hypothetical protein